jgi:hypothetical protein
MGNPKVFEEYPKWKYQEGQSPRLVQTHQEEAELGDKWFEKPDMTNHGFDLAAAIGSGHVPGYEPVEFPKWRYAREIPGGRIVNSWVEQDALEEAYPDITWYDCADFTNSGEPSTDTTSMMATGTQFGVTGEDTPKNVLAPVPEMKQGKAAQRASSVAEQSDDDDFDTDDTDDTQGTMTSDEGAASNNFDNASGVNPGDDPKEDGDHVNGSVVGKVEKPEAEKATAKTTKATPAKAKSKKGEDLL